MDSRRKIGNIILFAAILLINTALGQIEPVADHFNRNFSSRLVQAECPDGYVRLEPIIRFLSDYSMIGWINLLEKKKNTQDVITIRIPSPNISPGGPPSPPIEISCIKQNAIENYKELFIRQAKTLEKLALYFEWAEKILKDTQYNFIDKIIESFYGNPSGSAEYLLKQEEPAPPCLLILNAFANGNKVEANWVNRANLQGLFNEGIRNGTVIYQIEENSPFYYFQYATISQIVNGEANLNNLKNNAKTFIRQFYDFKKRVIKSSESFYQQYKDIANEQRLRQFEQLVDKFTQENATTTKLYLTSDREGSTCRLFLNVILTGKTPAGRDASNFIQNILKPQLEMVSSTIQELDKIIIQFKPATIEVTTTEISIAVIPPIIFNQEHKGTSSFAEITPEKIFNEIRDWLFKIAPTVFILLVVIGGILYLLTPVNLQNIQTGSEYIKWAVIGYFVLLVISGILSALKGILGAP